MTRAVPVLSSARPMPSAPAMTISTDQSTLRRAVLAEQQPIMIINPAASIAATSMLNHPRATTLTIAPRIISAVHAFSWRRGLESSMALTRKKSRELRC